MKKIFCFLLACLCSFSLSAHGDNSLVDYISSLREKCPTPKLDGDDKELVICHLNGCSQGGNRHCVIPTPKKDDDGDDKLKFCWTPELGSPPTKK